MYAEYHSILEKIYVCTVHTSTSVLIPHKVWHQFSACLHLISTHDVSSVCFLTVYTVFYLEYDLKDCHCCFSKNMTMHCSMSKCISPYIIIIQTTSSHTQSSPCPKHWRVSAVATVLYIFFSTVAHFGQRLIIEKLASAWFSLMKAPSCRPARLALLFITALCGAGSPNGLAVPKEL